MSGGKDWLLPPPVPALNVWREEGRQSEKERRGKVREEREATWSEFPIVFVRNQIASEKTCRSR